MNRKEFLKSLGAVGVVGAAGVTLGSRVSPAQPSPRNTACVLIPTETAGPFPLDLTDNAEFFRADIREDREGIELTVKMRVIGEDNCEPMPNVRVHIWHCDKDGVYSGYNTGNNPGDVNSTFCRGHQYTDQNGEVEFITIFPGWYTGRICHIHFQVYVSSNYSAVSQFTFPLEPKNALYSESPSVYTKGADPLSFSQDNIFADGHEYQLATLVKEGNNLYSTFFEATVRGSGTTDVGHYERRREQYLSVGNVFPHPAIHQLNIPFEVQATNRVVVTAYDTSGRKLAEICDKDFSAGNHQLELNTHELCGLSNTVVLEFAVHTREGIFKVPRVVTLR